MFNYALFNKVIVTVVLWVYGVQSYGNDYSVGHFCHLDQRMKIQNNIVSNKLSIVINSWD